MSKLQVLLLLVSLTAHAQEGTPAAPAVAPVEAQPAPLIAPPAPAELEKALPASVTGTVTDADTRKPVADVVVTLTSPSGEENLEVTTKNGAFVFKNVTPGRNAIKFEGPSYRLFTRTLDVMAGKELRTDTSLLPDQVTGEEIVVTGTRIPRLEVGKAAPVTLVSREQITSSGKASVGAVLQSLPEQAGGINTQVNNGGDGSTRVDLRGLGSHRTLVLLNGRRMVAGGTGADSSADLSTIPTAAIQRIEILKDGASAIYGSDAISGVVNIITRQNYTGTEINAFSGISQRGDGLIYDLGFTTGVGNERGNILFSGTYYGQEAVWAGNRSFSRFDRGTSGYDWASRQIYTGGSSAGPNGYFGTAVGEGNAAWAELKSKYPTTSTFTFDNGTYRPFKGTGVTEAGGDLYNYQVDNYLVTPLHRFNLFSTGTVRIAGSVKGYFEALFAHRESDQKLAPEPVFFDGEEIVISSANVYNPFGVDFRKARVRMSGFGNRQFMQDLDTFRIVTGVKGEIPLLTNWNWDVAFNFGRTQGVQNKTGLLQRSKLASAVGPSFRDADGIARCGAEGAVIEGCVPLNIFGGPTAMTKEMREYLSYKGAQYGYNQQLSITGITSAEVVKVFNAHSPIGFALGYEHRREAAAAIPDPLTAKGDTTGNKGEATAGAFYLNEAFAEVNAPLVGRLGSFAGPGNLLEVSAAARLVSYSTFGNNLTYKLGARLSPVQDVTIRGTVSTAFRAPNIAELYSGTGDGFPGVSDPCANRVPGTPQDAACTAAGIPSDHSDDRTQLRTRGGGNTALKPETANALTFGGVIQPRFFKDVSLTVDYYNIAVKNSISSAGASVILASCYPNEAGVAPALCNQIQRDDTHAIKTIDDRLTNVGGDRIGGIDLAFDYDPMTPIGRFGFSANANWLAHYDRTLADQRVIHAKGTYDLSIPLPEWRGTFGLRWANAGFNAAANLRWLAGFKECEDNNCQASKPGLAPARSRGVEGYASMDLNAGYRFSHAGGSASNVQLGVNNVMDRLPAYIVNGFAAASHTDYDYMGRYFYVRLSHEFQ
jgi:outer membrane receptor protein involved in Fe transport